MKFWKAQTRQHAAPNRTERHAIRSSRMPVHSSLPVSHAKSFRKEERSFYLLLWLPRPQDNMWREHSWPDRFQECKPKQAWQFPAQHRREMLRSIATKGIEPIEDRCVGIRSNGLDLKATDLH